MATSWRPASLRRAIGDQDRIVGLDHGEIADAGAGDQPALGVDQAVLGCRRAGRRPGPRCRPRPSAAAPRAPARSRGRTSRDRRARPRSGRLFSMTALSIGCAGTASYGSSGTSKAPPGASLSASKARLTPARIGAAWVRSSARMRSARNRNMPLFQRWPPSASIASAAGSSGFSTKRATRSAPGAPGQRRAGLDVAVAGLGPGRRDAEGHELARRGQRQGGIERGIEGLRRLHQMVRGADPEQRRRRRTAAWRRGRRARSRPRCCVRPARAAGCGASAGSIRSSSRRTRKSWALAPTVTTCSGRARASRRRAVCSSSDCSPASWASCLGRVSRLTGHRRVPEPPARITGTSMAKAVAAPSWIQRKPAAEASPAGRPGPASSAPARAHAPRRLSDAPRIAGPGCQIVSAAAADGRRKASGACRAGVALAEAYRNKSLDFARRPHPRLDRAGRADAGICQCRDAIERTPCRQPIRIAPRSTRTTICAPRCRSFRPGSTATRRPAGPSARAGRAASISPMATARARRSTCSCRGRGRPRRRCSSSSTAATGRAGIARTSRSSPSRWSKPAPRSP